MFDLDDDRVTSEETTNYKYDEDGEKQMKYQTLEIKDFNFFPTLDVHPMNNGPELISHLSLLGLFKDGHLVAEELSKYISIVLQVKHTDEDDIYYQRSKFRKCRLEDFEDR